MKEKNKQAKSTAVVKSVPAAKGTVVKRPAPKVDFQPDGSCTITHYEYVSDVETNSGTQVGSNFANPQNTAMFTWLSAIATRFEMYQFKKLKFHYKPSISTNSNGFVIIGFDFDAYDINPNKVEMLAWKYSAKSALWQSCSVDCSSDSRMSTWRYCDSGVNTPRGDIRLDYLGKLVVLTYSDAPQFAGEVFVEYTVQFRQPSYKIPPALYLKLNRDGPMVSTSDWLGPLSHLVGNILYQVVDQNTMLIETAGKFLIDVYTTNTAAPSSDVGINFTVPASSPSSKFDSTATFSNHSTGSSIAQYLLDLQVPPVQLDFFGANGGLITPYLRIATYLTDLD